MHRFVTKKMETWRRRKNQCGLTVVWSQYKDPPPKKQEKKGLPVVSLKPTPKKGTLEGGHNRVIPHGVGVPRQPFGGVITPCPPTTFGRPFCERSCLWWLVIPPQTKKDRALVSKLTNTQTILSMQWCVCETKTMGLAIVMF